MLRPVLLDALGGYDRGQARADVAAGVIVGVVAVPLAIAFAIAGGLPPSYGLITAVVAGTLVSALGGSRVQIAGPTGAFVVLVYGIVQQHGVDGLAVATLLAGGLLITLGLAGLGSVIKYVPYPVTTGFTSGIAVVILTGQLKDLLGLDMPAAPPGFTDLLQAYAGHLGSVDPVTVLVGGATLLILWQWPRVSHRVPAPVVALVAATAAVSLLGLDVETVGSRFGPMAPALPRPHLPRLAGLDLGALIGPAVAIALLGAVESLLSAVVADGMTGQRHRSNMELVAQGLANVASPLLGGMPATGAIARTATNVRNGGRTPVAGLVHAATVLATSLFLARWVGLIPMAALAAILVTVAYHMSDWRSFVAEFSAPRSDVLVLLSTFSLTVLVDLTVAIEVGMVLAAFLFMRRMAEVTNVVAVTAESPAGHSSAAPVPEGVQVYEINGPFFFGAAEKFSETLHTVSTRPRVLILGMRGVNAVDSTGLHALRQLLRRTRADGTRVILVGVHAQPMVAMERAGLLDAVGAEDLAGTVEEALAMASSGIAPTPGAPPPPVSAGG